MGCGGGGGQGIMKDRKGRIELKNLTPEELEAFVISLEEKPFRARQLARWLYGRGARSFGEMTDLARGFREKLEARAWIHFLEPVKVVTSSDGTKKYRFLLEDGEAIESVLLLEKDHYTLCLSTQAGCALGCKFCLTGKRGLKRNLEPSEILDQIIGVRATLRPERIITNLVLMGMGEPLENFPNVVRALEVIRSPLGLQFSHRRVTLSTAGILPRMEELGLRQKFVKLAISLNASTDQQRSALMPINRKYPLGDLLAACRRIPLASREKITFEYVLIRGINDSEEDARRVALLLRGIRAKINLIPFNEHPESPFQRPGEKFVQRFQEVLRAGGFTPSVRQSRGEDILAACGQLGGPAPRSLANGN
jgi:23S rRNA (adenine2503-C2)-methyltransferase